MIRVTIITATAMIVMKIITIIIGSKIVFVNQVLITICRSQVETVNQNALSDTVFNVQSSWCHRLQSASPIVFSLKMVWWISFVNECNRDIFQKTMMSLFRKMLEKVLLHTCAILLIFRAIVLAIVLSVPKFPDCLFNILF